MLKAAKFTLKCTLTLSQAAIVNIYIFKVVIFPKANDCGYLKKFSNLISYYQN